MDSVVDKLAEIEEAAEAIVRHAHDKKSDIEKELQKEREEFDRETEEKTRGRLLAIRQENELKKDFEQNHAAYARQILKKMIEV